MSFTVTLPLVVKTTSSLTPNVFCTIVLSDVIDSWIYVEPSPLIDDLKDVPLKFNNALLSTPVDTFNTDASALTTPPEIVNLFCSNVLRFTVPVLSCEPISDVPSVPVTEPIVISLPSEDNIFILLLFKIDELTLLSSIVNSPFSLSTNGPLKPLTLLTPLIVKLCSLSINMPPLSSPTISYSPVPLTTKSSANVPTESIWSKLLEYVLNPYSTLSVPSNTYSAISPSRTALTNEALASLVNTKLPLL